MIQKDKRGAGSGVFLKKIKLLKSYATGNPAWCSWQLTDKCNFRCKFCSIWKKQSGAVEQSLTDIEKSASRLAEMGTMMVSLTGGEPFMRTDLPEIVQAISKYHFAFVTTNGSLVTRERAAQLSKAGLWGIGVSIDYANSERHDKARGYSGSFCKAIEAIKILQQCRNAGRPQVNIMFTLLDDNFNDLIKLAEISKELGCMIRVQPYSELKTGDKELNCREPVTERLLNLQKRFPNIITNPVAIEKFDLAINEGVDGCIAGKYMLNIDPRGNVSICPENQDNPVGHILTDDIKTLKQRLNENHRKNTCKKCWYNCRNEIEVSYTFRGMLYGARRNFFDSFTS